MFLSFPPPTKMFQFRGLAHLTVCQVFSLTGCPIRISADLISFANPRGFSQLTTSFVASKSLGIPHTLFFRFLSIQYRLLSISDLSLFSLNCVNERCKPRFTKNSIAVSLRYTRSDAVVTFL